MKVHVEWDFEGTEFQDLSYDQALECSGLPQTVLIPIDVAYEDNEGISDWISEEYKYNAYNWWEV